MKFKNFNIKLDKRLLGIALSVAALAALALLVVMMIGTMGKNKRSEVSSKQPESVIEPYIGKSALMGETVIQRIYADSDKAHQVATAVDNELSRIDSLFSKNNTDSAIYKINAQAGMTEINRYRPPSEVYNFLKRVYDLCDSLDGAYDFTAGPLKTLWGFSGSFGIGEVPRYNKVQEALKKVNYKNIVFDDKDKSVWLKKPFMALDVDTAAKGYALEKAKEVLNKNGITNGAIFIGESVLTLGKMPDGTDFKVNIRDPFGDTEDVFATVSMSDGIMSTVGGYQNFFEKNGVRYHDIIDPETGYPSDSNLQSVTVISDDGVLARCMAQVIFTQGSEAAKKYLNDPDFMLIAVDMNKDVYVSPALKEKVKLNNGFHWVEDLY